MSEWKEVKLGDVCDVITKGTTPSNIGDSFVDEGIKFIRSEMLGRDKYINNSGFLFISEETHQRLRRSQLKEKDILFSMAGVYLGKTAILRKEDVPSNTNQAVAIIRVNGTKADVEYIYYCLNHPHIVKTVNASCAQSAQPNINLKQIGEISFLTPPLGIQQRIASILSSLDDKIAVNKKICENLEAQAQALFKHWFVDFAPFKDGKFVESELGMIPEGWRVGTLGDYCKVKSGFAFKSSMWTNAGDLVIKIKNIQENGDLNLNDCSFVSHESAVNATDFKAKCGDLIIAMTGATIGKFCIIPSIKENVYINQRVGKFFLGDNPIMKLPFIYCALSLDSIKKKIISSGIGSAQPNISGKDIESISFVFNKDEIDKFNSLCYSYFVNIIKLREEISKLSTLRDTLLPKLMSGEIKI